MCSLTQRRRCAFSAVVDGLPKVTVWGRRGGKSSRARHKCSADRTATVRAPANSAVSVGALFAAPVVFNIRVRIYTRYRCCRQPTLKRSRIGNSFFFVVISFYAYINIIIIYRIRSHEYSNSMAIKTKVQ